MRPRRYRYRGRARAARTRDAPTSAEALYAAERTLLEGFRVIPLIHLPDVYGVSPRVKGGPASRRRASGASRISGWKARGHDVPYRLLLIFTVAVVASVAVVDLLVLGNTRAAFERVEAQRARRAGAQFRKEFDRRRREIVRAVNAIAASEATRKSPSRRTTRAYYDYAAPAGRHPRSGYAGTGRGRRRDRSSAAMAGALRLQGGVAHGGEDWKQRGAFLRREELPEGVTLALVAVAGGGRGRPQAVRGRRAAVGPRVPLHAGAAGRDARAAVSQPGARFTPAELIDAAVRRPVPEYCVR